MDRTPRRAVLTWWGVGSEPRLRPGVASEMRPSARRIWATSAPGPRARAAPPSRSPVSACATSALTSAPRERRPRSICDRGRSAYAGRETARSPRARSPSRRRRRPAIAPVSAVASLPLPSARSGSRRRGSSRCCRWRSGRRCSHAGGAHGRPRRSSGSRRARPGGGRDDPAGHGERRARGDVTIVALGKGVPDTLAAADTLMEEGIDAEVIDLRCLATAGYRHHPRLGCRHEPTRGRRGGAALGRLVGRRPRRRGRARHVRPRRRVDRRQRRDPVPCSRRWRTPTSPTRRPSASAVRARLGCGRWPPEAVTVLSESRPSLRPTL